MVFRIEQLRETGGFANVSHRPFFLCCGRYDLARQRYQEEFEFVENSGLFERVAKIQGVDEQRTTMVFRWIGPPE